MLQTYTITQQQKLIDLNGPSQYFTINFHVKSHDGKPFKALVIDEKTLNSNSVLEHKIAENGQIGGTISNNDGPHQSFYLVLKSDEETPRQVDVTIQKQEIQKQEQQINSNQLENNSINIEKQKQQQQQQQQQLLSNNNFSNQSTTNNNLKKNIFNWKIIIIILVVIVILFLCWNFWGKDYFHTKFNKKINNLQTENPTMITSSDNINSLPLSQSSQSSQISDSQQISLEKTSNLLSRMNKLKF